MNDTKTYFCVDIETDGPFIGINPLRSIGCAVVQDKRIVNVEHWNILPYGDPDEDTMKWWQQWPRARAHLETDMMPMPDAIKKFDAFVREFSEHRYFVTDAPWFDWAWMRHHLMLITGDTPFRGYIPYTWIARGEGIKLPKIPNAHPHVAEFDAIEMACQFIHLQEKRDAKV